MQKSKCRVWLVRPTFLSFESFDDFNSVTFSRLKSCIDWMSPFLKRMGQFGPKFQVEWDVPHQPFFIWKTRCIDLSYGIRMCTEIYFVFSQFTCLTYGRTGGQLLIARPRLHSSCSAVKTVGKNRPTPIRWYQVVPIQTHTEGTDWPCRILCMWWIVAKRVRDLRREFKASSSRRQRVELMLDDRLTQWTTM